MKDGVEWDTVICKVLLGLRASKSVQTFQKNPLIFFSREQQTVTQPRFPHRHRIETSRYDFNS